MAPGTSNSENYQVLARRFRPQSLQELVGQRTILETLTQALDSGRVPHAFLFSGSRGVGKTTLARILARCLNCETGVSSTPCGKCAMCTTILAGASPDVQEIDAASHNLVDDIRELRDRVGFASMGGRYKVYILDEVHMLTRNAFNAFLKTLEEPPRGVVFILATTELHKVPDTIQSRCQVLLFQSLSEPEIVQRLAAICSDEGLAIADEVLHEIARAARGGMRDAETMLERILPVARERGAEFGIEDYRRLAHRTGQAEVVEVVASLLRGEAAPAMHFVAALVATGVDEREVLGEVLEVLRAMLLIKVDGDDTGLVTTGGELRQRLVELAGAIDSLRLDATIQAALLGRERIRRTEDRRLVLEVSMLRMAEAGRLPQLAELIDGIRAGRPLTAAAPATAPAGVPATGGGGAGGDLKARLLALCQQRKGILTATLELCSVHGPDDDGAVRLVVETERKLHRDRLASREIQDEVRGMLAEILGKAVTLAVTVKGQPEAGARPPRPAASRPTRTRPGAAARKVVDRFDGRIVEMDEPSD